MEEKRKEEIDLLLSSKFEKELKDFIENSKKITESKYQKKDYEEKDYDER